jgi:hypothetical protein
LERWSICGLRAVAAIDVLIDDRRAQLSRPAGSELPLRRK